VAGALVKFVVRGQAKFVHEFARVEYPVLARRIREQGAWDVIATYELERRDRESRMEGLEVGVSIPEAILVYTQQESCRGVEPKVLAELGQQILEAAQEHEELV